MKNLKLDYTPAFGNSVIVRGSELSGEKSLSVNGTMYKIVTRVKRFVDLTNQDIAGHPLESYDNILDVMKTKYPDFDATEIVTVIRFV